MEPAPKPTRERMMDVAEPLFARHGFGGVTVDEVTAAVGVKKPDLYNHFRDKNDLYVAVRLRRLGCLQADLARALEATAPPAERLIAVTVALLQNPYFLAAQYERQRETFLDAAARDQLFARSYQVVYRPLQRFLHEIGVPEARQARAYEMLIALVAHFARVEPPGNDPERLARLGAVVADLWQHGAGAHYP